MGRMSGYVDGLGSGATWANRRMRGADRGNVSMRTVGPLVRIGLFSRDGLVTMHDQARTLSDIASWRPTLPARTPAMTAPQTRGVFISYRRQDAAFPAGWLYEQLANTFGEPYVFKDVDSIRPGEDFVDVIKTAVRSCHTMLVVIGPKWLSMADKRGGRRIDDPDDFIRLEIETATSHNLQIIPILVLEAEMPSVDALPPSIAPLARRHAIEISSTRFKSDVARLIHAVDQQRRARQAMMHGDGSAVVPDQPRTPPDPRPVSSPRLLANRYELIGVLGYGGMSEVHHARDTRLGRDVAVKLLGAGLARDPRLPARLRRETELAATFRHPAIVAVYDAGETQSESGLLAYVVMEYVDGHTLRDILKTAGPIPEQHVVNIGAQVCAAVDVGHRHHVIHGDIMLSNIMINGAGAVKVLNFGVAGALGQGDTDSGPSAKGVRGDVYAVGCILYELLTGRPPYLEGSPATPSALNPAVSPALDAIVRKALSADPTDSYRNAAALHSDLLRITGHETPPAGTEALHDSPRTARPTPVPSREHPAAEPTSHSNGSARRRRAGQALVAALAVLITLTLTGAAGYWLLSRTPRTAEQITVPPVIGLSDPDATARLTDVGLRVSRQPQAVSAPEQVGKVVQSDPTFGTVVAAGSRVNITIGAAQTNQPNPKPHNQPNPKPPDPTLLLPDLTGRSADEAKQLLTSKGLRVRLEEVEAESPAGVVISSDPPPGTRVEGGSTVTLVTAKERAPQPLPDVRGQSLSSATRILGAAGFRKIATQTVAVTDPALDDVVVQQSPGPGSPTDPDTTIRIVVGQAVPPAVGLGQSAP
jgi:eukaryotic-like serine/threonine-protein kinase